MFEHVVVAAHFASANSPLFSSLEELRARGTRKVTLVDVLRSHHVEEHAPEHRQEAERRLAEEQSALQASGFDVTIEVRTGQPAHELATTARARGASLILVGSRGEQYFREFMRGSTILQLIRKASVPVLIEPIAGESRQVRGRGFDRLLLATDFSTSVEDAEATFAELAAQARQVVLVHVIEQEDLEELGAEGARAQAESTMNAMADRLPRITTAPVIRVVAGTASTEINRIAAEEGVSMIVMGKRGRSPIRELLLGSTTQNVVRYASCSVLMVPQRSGVG